MRAKLAMLKADKSRQLAEQPQQDGEGAGATEEEDAEEDEDRDEQPNVVVINWKTHANELASLRRFCRQLISANV